jgi:DNA repair protein RecO (recombination protein O)
MEWDAPAIVLDARPYGEGDAIVTVMTEEHGAHRGMVRGGAARAHIPTWQVGNFVQIRWTARLSDQLGNFAGETLHANAAHVMDDPMALAMLTAACAVAEGALPEREPHPQVFDGLLRLIAHLPLGEAVLADLVRWETVLLAELGYGLDLSSCAVTGETTGLAFVSPRTGRAVTEAAAGVWTARLLRLPSFLLPRSTTGTPSPLEGEGRGGGASGTDLGGSTPPPNLGPLHGPSPQGEGEKSALTPTPADILDGLRLTGHFLTRDAFGQRHRPLPQARQMLYDRVAALAVESETQNAG